MMRNPLALFRYLSANLPINFPDILLKELKRLHKETSRPLNILDLGAGPGRYWQEKKLSTFLSSSGSKVTLFDASVEFNSETFPKGVLIKRVLGVVPQDLRIIRDDEFDFVVAIDLIEHLEKSQGFLLLYEIDRISRGASAVMTPNGFVWQPPSLNNTFNAHISGWHPKELSNLGWKAQRSQIGVKQLYEAYGLQKYKKDNQIFLEAISLLKIITFYLPSVGFSFIAIKRTKNPRIKEHL